ncbi:hypothetical protein QBC39DRAFT_5777 [Podospora conica]|nr:hypothetical protein QBC39DRAFT_5777 [Schizothecium conicum]
MGVVIICNPGHPPMRAMTPLPLHIAILQGSGCHTVKCEYKYVATPVAEPRLPVDTRWISRQLPIAPWRMAFTTPRNEEITLSMQRCPWPPRMVYVGRSMADDPDIATEPARTTMRLRQDIAVPVICQSVVDLIEFTLGQQLEVERFDAAYYVFGEEYPGVYAMESVVLRYTEVNLEGVAGPWGDRKFCIAANINADFHCGIIMPMPLPGVAGASKHEKTGGKGRGKKEGGRERQRT